MKKRSLLLALILVLLVAFAACTPAEEADGKNAPEDLYGSLLEHFAKIIENPGNIEAPAEGELGVVEAALALGKDALSTIGYATKDLNGDGIPELLIGVFQKASGAYTKNEVYAVYTYQDDQPVLVLEGRSRNAYSLMEGDSFYFMGSGGALYSAFGEFELDQTGKLVCKEFYFTYDKEDAPNGIALYHNTSGEWNPKLAEELDLTENEFWGLQDKLAEKTVSLTDRKFSEQ